MSILDSAKRRYSTKVFDATKKISAEDINKLKEIIRLSPSSVNIQPWHFILTNTDSGKQKILPSMQGPYQFNAPKIQDASHVMVFCVKTDLDQDYLDSLLAKEKSDGRMINDEVETRIKEGREWFFGKHNNDPTDLMSWTSNQLYLALGNLLLAAADMDIDSVPIEGFDAEILSEQLNLKEKNLQPMVLVALGYHSNDDFNFSLPKSRFSMESIFTEI